MWWLPFSESGIVPAAYLPTCVSSIGFDFFLLYCAKACSSLNHHYHGDHAECWENHDTYSMSLVYFLKYHVKLQRILRYCQASLKLCWCMVTNFDRSISFLLACSSLAILLILPCCSFLFFISVNISVYPLPCLTTKGVVCVADVLVSPTATTLISLDNWDHWYQGLDFLSSLYAGRVDTTRFSRQGGWQ